MRIRLTFDHHAFKARGKFRCACGKKFVRTVTAGWSENPFHQWRGKEAALNAEKEALAIATLEEGYECPACGKEVKPSSTEKVGWLS